MGSSNGSADVRLVDGGHQLPNARGLSRSSMPFIVRLYDLPQTALPLLADGMCFAKIPY